MSAGFLFGGNESILVLVVMVAQLCGYTKTQWIVYFKGTNIMQCGLYLN